MIIQSYRDFFFAHQYRFVPIEYLRNFATEISTFSLLSSTLHGPLWNFPPESACCSVNTPWRRDFAFFMIKTAETTRLSGLAQWKALLPPFAWPADFRREMKNERKTVWTIDEALPPCHALWNVYKLAASARLDICWLCQGICRTLLITSNIRHDDPTAR